MKSVSLMIAAALFATNVAHAANEGGKAGGGIQRDGAYLTFGSAGYHVGVEPMDEIPGLDLLKKTVSGLHIADTYKFKMLNLLISSDQRHYFQVDGSTLTWAKRKALLKSYIDALQIPASEISHLVIFAVTSPSTGETYLLPEFFKLKKVEEQAAILYHELHWLLLPDSDYRSVIKKEIDFQKFLEDGSPEYDRKVFASFDEVFDDNSISVQAALSRDVHEGVLDGIIRDRILDLGAVFGAGFIWRLFDPGGCGASCFPARYGFEERKDALMENLLRLAEALPESQFIARVMDHRASIVVSSDDMLKRGFDWSIGIDRAPTPRRIQLKGGLISFMSPQFPPGREAEFLKGLLMDRSYQ